MVSTDSSATKEGWVHVTVRPSVRDALSAMRRTISTRRLPSAGEVVAALVAHANTMQPEDLRGLFIAWQLSADRGDAAPVGTDRGSFVSAPRTNGEGRLHKRKQSATKPAPPAMDRAKGGRKAGGKHDRR